MFSFEIIEDDRIVVLTLAGTITVDDYQTAASEYFRAVKSRGISRVLIDGREFKGWSTKVAESISFHVWMDSRLVFEKIALVSQLVSQEGMRDEINRFTEFFENAGKDIRKFGPEQYRAALDWLKADGEVDVPS